MRCSGIWGSPLRVRNAGSGGGIGITFRCNGTKLLSFGGGGGGGVAYEIVDGAKRYSYGAGLGGGIQFFRGDSTVFSNGAGGGGGIQCDMDCDTESCMCPSSSLQTLGVTLDKDNTRWKYLKRLKRVHHEIASCWDTGMLEVKGSGGAGGGLQMAGIDRSSPNAHVSLSLSSFNNPCSPSCMESAKYVASPSPLFARADEGLRSTCNYTTIAKGTQDCVRICMNSNYTQCTCPCFVQSFMVANCTWAEAISCTK